MAQLSGYVSEHAAYHHGEASLQSTIVGMAQSFVGSNNINLLAPKGQFGTRLQVGQPACLHWLSARNCTQPASDCYARDWASHACLASLCFGCPG